MKMLEDIVNHLWLRLALFCKDRRMVFLFLFSAACFLFCMADLNFNADEKANIPIGIVNLEKAPDTGGAELVRRISGQPAISVMEGEYEELEQKMLRGYIRCILVIDEDYSRKVQKGSVRKLITAYHEQEDNVASLITDIVAGEMMYDICLARGYDAYEGLPEEKGAARYTKEEYYAYAAGLIGNDDFDFAFDFSYVDQKGEEKQGMGNALFYRQAVAAAAAMLMSLIQLVAMAGVQAEKEQKLMLRKKLMSGGRISSALGNAIGTLLAAGVLSMLLAAIFAMTACIGYFMGDRGIASNEFLTDEKREVFLETERFLKFEKFFWLFWTSVLFSIMMALVYYFLAVVLRSMFAYQAMAAMVLLGTGVSGFLFMAQGTLIGTLPAWFGRIPNCAYLRWVTEVLLLY